MPCTIASVQNFFVVRWGAPEPVDFDRVVAAVERLREEMGAPVCYLGIMPDDMPRIDNDARDGFMRLTEQALPHCSVLAVAVEARGFRGAIMRTAMAAITLLTRKYDRLKFVDSVDAALVACGPHLLEDRQSVADVIQRVGGEVPPEFAMSAASAGA